MKLRRSIFTINAKPPRLVSLVATLSCLMIGSSANGATLLQWNTFGNAGTETTEASTFNVTGLGASNLTLGAGVTAAGNTNRFGGSNWFDTGDSNPTTLAQSIAGNDFIQFIVTPNSGFAFSVTDFVFTWDRSNSGAVSVALRSSADNFGSNLGLNAATTSLGSNTFTISGITNLSSATTFRLYGYGATGAAGTGGFDTSSNVVNVQLNGSVGAIAATAQIYWDSNGNTGGVGGSGTWNSSSTSFSTATAGTDAAARTAVTDAVIFDGTAGTVTVDSTVQAEGGITFNTDAYSITSGTIGLGTTNSITTATGVGATIGSSLTGSSGMAKLGAGTLTLTGASDYTGGTTVTAGTLVLGTGSSIAGNVTNNATLSFNRSDALTFSGNISGSGIVIKDGASTTILTGANSYAGTTITAGTLQIGSGSTTGTLGSGAVTNNATLSFNRSDSMTVANAISGSGSVSQSGAGTTILTGSNSYGTTTISAGTLQIGSDSTTGTLGGGAVTNNASLSFNRSDSMTVANSISGSGTVSQSGAGTTILTGANSYGTTSVSTGTLQIGDGGTSGTLGNGAVTNNATLAFNRSDAATISNAIGGTGLVIQLGNGTTTLGVSNGYSGGTTISSGALIAGATGALGSGAVTMSGGSLLGGAGTSTSNAITIGTAASTSNSAFSVSYNFGTSSGSAAPSSSNAVGFTVGSVGRGNNFGTTTLLDNGSTSNNSGASGQFNASAATQNGALNTGTSTYFDITLTRTMATSVSLDNIIFGSRSTGTGPTQYTIRSTGDLATSLAAGSLPGTTWTAVNSNLTDSTISTEGTTFRIYGFNGSGAVGSTAVWRIDDFTLTGTSTTNIAAAGTGTLGISDAGIATFSGGITVNNTATLSAVSGGTANFTNSITGPGSITKSGSGIVTLNGTNSYLGDTTVSEGTLLVNGNNSTANAAVTVALGATLGGNGTVGGATTISGAHSPGASADTVGTQAFSSTLTYASSSIFNWDLNANSESTGFDTVSAVGAITAGGVFNVVLGSGVDQTAAFWSTTGGNSKTWALATIFGKELESTFSSVMVTGGTPEFAALGQFTFNGNNLSWQAIPEPTSALAGLLLGAGLLRRRRSA